MEVVRAFTCQGASSPPDIPDPFLSLSLATHNRLCEYHFKQCYRMRFIRYIVFTINNVINNKIEGGSLLKLEERVYCFFELWNFFWKYRRFDR